MLTLYENEESGANRLSKEEIVAAGQKYCDSSFDMAEAGRSYTAWVGVKTLLEKGYVWKQSSPPRYSLTDTGKAMAAQLVRASRKGSQRSQMASIPASEPSTSTNLQSSQPDGVDRIQGDERATTPTIRTEPVLQASVTGTSGRLTVALTTSSASQILPGIIQQSQQEPYVISSDEDEADLTSSTTILTAHRNEVILSDATIDTNKAATTSDTPQFEQFWYTYLDGEGQHVSTSQNAAIHVDDMSFNILYKIKYHTSQESHSFASNVSMTNPIDKNFACGYLKEHVADSLCPGLGPHDIPTTPNKLIGKNVHTLQVSASVADVDDHPVIQELSSDDLWTLQYEPEAYSQKSATEYAASEYDDVMDANNSQGLTQQSEISDTSAYVNSQPLSQLDPDAVTLSQMSAPETTRDFSSVQCPSYPPGSFEVVLVLDSREIKSRRDRDYMRDMLHQRGVTVDVRSLELGDAIWVARQCTDDGPVDELFLDIVLERKRMDDLVSSIKDGRFKEQKVRSEKEVDAFSTVFMNFVLTLVNTSIDLRSQQQSKCFMSLKNSIWMKPFGSVNKQCRRP
jgi:ERCC4 domain